MDWVGTGVNHQVFVPPPQTKQLSEPYVLYAGRLLERKGLIALLRAASLVSKEAPGVKFLLLGDGPLKNYLEKEAERLHIQSRFLLLGHIPFRARQQELIEFYQRAAIFVQPSLYEGLPATLLEAMACGRAVVATTVGGHPDAIRHGTNGLLVPPNDPQALATSLLTLLQDGTMRQALGQAARNTIEERFTWDAVAQRTLQCYQKVVEQ